MKRPLRDFISVDMQTTGLRVDIAGAVAEGYFADERHGARLLAAILRRGKQPIPYRITEAGRKALRGEG